MINAEERWKEDLVNEQHWNQQKQKFHMLDLAFPLSAKLHVASNF